MKCKKCREENNLVEMDFLGIGPKLGRRSIGKQSYKYKCPLCGTEERIRPAELREREREESQEKIF